MTSPGPHWVVASVLMYFIACLLPAIKGFESSNLQGWLCLIAGAQATFQWIFSGRHQSFIPWTIILWWFANPIYFLAVVAYWRRWKRTAAVLGSLAVFPALHFEFVGREDVLAGCVIWVASLQLFALNGIWHIVIDCRGRLETSPTATGQRLS